MNKTTTPPEDYLLLKDAAAYLGVSPQTLRRWDESGKLKSFRHPANEYRYYRRADLEAFRPQYGAASAEGSGRHFFERVVADVEGNGRLRDPQREAHRAVREHFETRPGAAIVQVPVGCGKTGIIATLPFGIARGRVLVVSPNVTIRSTLASALDISNPECFWTKTRALSHFQEGPYVAVLDGVDANIHDCLESHFVVTNIHQLASCADRWLPQFPPNFFDMILVDEAHHNVAPSWKKVFQRFPDAKVVGLTATPFRGDEQPLAGEVIYRYSFTRAMVKGYIKQLTSSNVAPSELYFEATRGERRRYTLDEVLALREEHWFRRGIAASPECNRHIVEASIQRCRQLRQETGIQHQVIAVACSVDHARQVAALFVECGFRANEIYGDMPEERKEEVLDRLRGGLLDAIVQVQMLGEGFDHPRLSVAAVLRPFRSLSPYVQFVGRVMRVLHEGKVGHPDNQGYVVSHVGLNNDTHWDDFKEVDRDDQELFHRWLTEKSSAEELAEARGGGGVPRRFDTGAVVQQEIVSHFIEEAFLDPDDPGVLDQFAEIALPGGLKLGDIVPREQLRERLRDEIKRRQAVPVAIAVSPQKRRQTARKRLADKPKSVAARILKDLGLAPNGFHLAKAKLARPGKRNYEVVIRRLHKAVDEQAGIKTGQRKTALDRVAAEAALKDLDSVGDKVRDEIRSRLAGE